VLRRYATHTYDKKCETAFGFTSVAASKEDHNVVLWQYEGTKSGEEDFDIYMSNLTKSSSETSSKRKSSSSLFERNVEHDGIRQAPRKPASLLIHFEERCIPKLGDTNSGCVLFLPDFGTLLRSLPHLCYHDAKHHDESDDKGDKKSDDEVDKGSDDGSFYERGYGDLGNDSDTVFFGHPCFQVTF